MLKMKNGDAPINGALGGVIAEPILEVEDLTIGFQLKKGRLRAVSGVLFSIDPGETFGLVG